MTKIAKSSGALAEKTLSSKENKFAQVMVKAGAELEAGRDPTDKAKSAATMKERADAARRRVRRASRRGLMMAGSLGGGGQEEETKTTLGA